MKVKITALREFPYGRMTFFKPWQEGRNKGSDFSLSYVMGRNIAIRWLFPHKQNSFGIRDQRETPIPPRTVRN